MLPPHTKTKNKTGGPLLALLSNIFLELPARPVGKEKEMRYSVWKERSKTRVMILYAENPKEPTKKLLKLISRIEGYKISICKSTLLVLSEN